MKRKLKELGIEGYQDLRANYDDKNSSIFEMQMLEIGKKIGIIEPDFELQDIELDKLGDWNRFHILNTYNFHINDREKGFEERKKRLINYYKEMGIKETDLSQMITRETSVRSNQVIREGESI